MAITRYEPGTSVGPVRSLRDEIDRVFDDFAQAFTPFRSALARPSLAWDFGPIRHGFMPNVDMRETDDAYILTAELPGMTKEMVDVTVSEDSVTLRGERKSEEEEKNECFICHEASYGAFERMIPMPTPINVDKVEAKMKDGILTLSLTKAAKTKKREVKILEAK